MASPFPEPCLENLQQMKKLGNQATRRYQGVRDATRRTHARKRALRERKLLQKTVPKNIGFLSSSCSFNSPVYVAM